MAPDSPAAASTATGTPAAAAPADTRLRLLEAAGPIFADKGYRAATIKEICDAAGANIAAVNYHFGDKEKLYAATLRHAHQSVAHVDDLRRAWPPGCPPEHKLGDLIRTVLRGMLANGRPAWHAQVLAREMVEPTAALDQLVELEIRPKARLLRQVIGEVTGLPPDDERTTLAATSVIGQCLFFHHDRAVIERLFPQFNYADPNTLERIADHVTEFTLRALRPTPPPPPHTPRPPRRRATRHGADPA